ncbi:hypothetical protein MNBD_GAMMA26-648 [hydrothermal vent metagenome]|uniref:Cytochrome c domain-containing protein n=1 Tax=hydrothermal vent metagenome TaxID=652676 RepID=A0A3B1B218_9ZZZZ
MKKIALTIACAFVLTGCTDSDEPTTGSADISPANTPQVADLAPATPKPAEVTPIAKTVPTTVKASTTPEAATTPVTSAGGTDIAAGEKAFAACAACHGIAGKKPLNELAPALAGKDAAFIAEQLQDFRSGKRQDQKMFIMNTMAGAIPDKKTIDNIAAYLATQTPK